MISRRGYSRSRAGGGNIIRLVFGLIVAAFAVISFLGSREYNPVTGENQYLSLTPQQEIALGLQAAPELIQEFGGSYGDSQLQAAIDQIGSDLLTSPLVQGTPWQWEFTVLDDPGTINAFALPGGQVFITLAMLNELDTEDQVAGVLAHEIVHVLARHSAQQVAKSDLMGGLVGAVAVASGDAGATQTAQMVGQLINMSYGRDAELQSDTLGICLMLDTGYDPNAMVDVMRVLEAAGGGGGQPEFFSTHPNPANRIEAIEQAIASADEICPEG